MTLIHRKLGMSNNTLLFYSFQEYIVLLFFSHTEQFETGGY